MSLTDITIDHLWSSLKDGEIVQNCSSLARYQPPCHAVVAKRVGGLVPPEPQSAKEDRAQ
jgi:hypothetical protein